MSHRLSYDKASSFPSPHPPPPSLLNHRINTIFPPVTRPSLHANLNNWLYGPLIGRRDLTSQQWKDIFRRALKASWLPAIITFLGPLLLIFAFIAAFDFSVTSLRLTPDMTIPQMNAARDLISLRLRWLAYAAASCFIIAPFAFAFLHRRLAAPHIRAAANSLGLSNVCTRCGYSLTNLPAITSNCPECGTPRTPPPVPAERDDAQA